MNIMESMFPKASKTASATASVDSSTSSSICANKAETEAHLWNTSDGPSTIADAEIVCDTVIPKPNTDANNCTKFCCDLVDLLLFVIIPEMTSKGQFSLLALKSDTFLGNGLKTFTG